MNNRPNHDRRRLALAGLGAGSSRQLRFRTLCVFGGLALAAVFILGVSPVWWSVVLVAIALIFALELWSAALEALTDVSHPGFAIEIKAIKNMVIGAALVTGVAALCMAIAARI